MTNQPLVSIIVPIYNVEQYVEQCIESLLYQTYKNIEIICVNDGSTDKSEEKLGYYQYYNRNVFIYDKPNGGLSSARNLGLDKALGKYIMFVDSDDYLEKDVVRKAVDTLESTDADFYVYGIQQFSETMTKEIEDTNAWFERRLQPSGLQELTFERRQRTNIHVCNKVFRKELVKDLRFIEGLLYEDIYFMWMCMFNSTKAYYEPDVGYRYRVRPDSIMSKSSSEKSVDKALHHLKNWMELVKTVSKDKEAFVNHYSELLTLLQGLTNRTMQLSEKYDRTLVSAYEHYCTDYLYRLYEPIIKPRVSIVVPVYNVEQYLEQCLDSLLRQTLDSYEIICIDDGSTDSSGVILDKYAKEFPQIKVIHKANRGLSSARNFGIRIARADYIAFVDSDDYVEPTTFEKAYNAMKDNDVDFVVFGAEPFKDSDEQTAQAIEEFTTWLQCHYTGKQAFTFEHAKNTVQCAWNKLYKTKVLKETIHFGEGLLYEDVSFVWWYYCYSKTAYYLDEQLYKYRIRQNSIMDNALKEHSYDKAIHHLKNIDYLIDQMSWDKQLFTKSKEVLKFLIDRHTRRAKRACPITEHHKIDAYSIELHRRLSDILLLYRGE